MIRRNYEKKKIFIEKQIHVPGPYGNLIGRGTFAFEEFVN